MSKTEIDQLEVEAFQLWMNGGEEAFYLIDVRPEQDFEFCHIEGAVNVPFDRLQTEFRSFPQDRKLVMMCHHGITSQKVCQLMLEFGFENIYNLVGGIHAWSEKIDQNIPTY